MFSDVELARFIWPIAGHGRKRSEGGSLGRSYEKNSDRPTSGDSVGVALGIVGVALGAYGWADEVTFFAYGDS